MSGEDLIERVFFCQFFMDFVSVSAVYDVHQFLFYSELPCIFAKNHIFRIFFGTKLFLILEK